MSQTEEYDMRLCGNIERKLGTEASKSKLYDGTLVFEINRDRERDEDK